MISRFEVTTTQGKGYVATNSATGFKTNQELIKIPQSVTVVTRDLIDDIGATKTSDILMFAGASQFYRGESIRQAIFSKRSDFFAPQLTVAVGVEAAK